MKIMRTLSSKYVSFVTLALAVATFPPICSATSHVFVLNDDGVWLASDSLWLHNDGFNNVTRSNKCKVVMQKGRLIFNAGAFRNLSELQESESALAFEDIYATQRKITKLMAHNQQSSPFPRDPNLYQLLDGIIQVQDGIFSARWGGINDDLSYEMDKFVGTPFAPGVPHGYGDVVDRVNRAGKFDLTIRERFIKDPKKELLAMLEEESQINPTVGPPYTVLLLHKDGTISDMSDTPLCTIPIEALYIPPAPVAPTVTKPETVNKAKHWWNLWKN